MYSCPLLMSTAYRAGRLLSLTKPRVRSSSWTSSEWRRDRRHGVISHFVVHYMDTCIYMLYMYINVHEEEAEKSLFIANRFNHPHIHVHVCTPPARARTHTHTHMHTYSDEAAQHRGDTGRTLTGSPHTHCPPIS